MLGTAQAYAGAAAAEQARTLDSFLDRAAFTTTAFNAGTVFWALGFLLAGWIGLTVAPFPRWLAGAFALLGALALLDLLVYVATDEFVLDVVKFPLLLLVLVARRGASAASRAGRDRDPEAPPRPELRGRACVALPPQLEVRR